MLGCYSLYGHLPGVPPQYLRNRLLCSLPGNGHQSAKVQRHRIDIICIVSIHYRSMRAGERGRGKMPTILFVDDEENILRLCKEEFEEAGYDVITASRGGAAIEDIIKDVTEGRYHIDLVVLDINMPGIDGKRVLKVLKDVAPSLPVIVHTAYDYRKDDFIMFGSDEYITKSSDLAKLKNTVRYLLQR